MSSESALGSGHLTFKGQLSGHTNWVTSLYVSVNQEKLVSGSRDKTLTVWNLDSDQEETGSYGVAKRRLIGHGDFVSDCVISHDGQFVLSSSWDKTIRLWDINSGEKVRTFKGHTKEVFSVAFSGDNRQIVSGGRDKNIKLWNTLGECKFDLSDRGHTEWVSSVCFSPNIRNPLVISGGWDKVVKVWDLSKCQLRNNLIGHTSFVNTVTVSPDSSLCASGGKDCTAMLWDLNKGAHLYSLDAKDEVVNDLKFSPNRFWLCAATSESIKIWDLESKKTVAELVPEVRKPSKKRPACISLCWSTDGSTLYSGYTDNTIRVWGIER